MMEFKHHMPVQIRFNDVDIVGHVNNAVYQEYFDRGRVEYFKSVFKRSIDWKKVGFVIASIQVDFFNPVFMDDTISIATKVESTGEKSLNMVQLVLKEGEDEPVAMARTVMVGFDYAKRESMKIPSDWLAMLEQFEGKAFL